MQFEWQQHGESATTMAIRVSINNNSHRSVVGKANWKLPQLWPRLNGIMQKSCLGTGCGDPNTISMRTSSRTGCSWDEVVRCCLC